MTPLVWRKVKGIVQRAAAIGSASRRLEYLKKTCGRDLVVRAQVESLLACYEPEEPFVKGPTSWRGRMILHYKIIGELGGGGTGAVYKAWDPVLARTVAIKTLMPLAGLFHERGQRFRREARCCSSISHPNVVAIHHFGRDRGTEFIVMEYVQGRRLDQVIPRGGLSLGVSLNYALQIAEALAAAHDAKIIHRDLKPANILITRAGVVKLLDFGLAKPPSQWRADLTQDGTFLGTPGYMAPEQALGKKADARSDIFAFGAVLYQLLTGRKAFETIFSMDATNTVLGKGPPPLKDSIDSLVGGIVNRCLQKEPSARFRTARALAHALRQALASLSEKRKRLRTA